MIVVLSICERDLNLQQALICTLLTGVCLLPLQHASSLEENARQIGKSATLFLCSHPWSGFIFALILTRGVHTPTLTTIFDTYFFQQFCLTLIFLAVCAPMLKVAKLERGCNGPMIDQLKPIIRLQKLSESSGLLEDAVASPCPEEECAHDYRASIIDRLVSLDSFLCSVSCLWHTCFPVELTRKRRYLSRTLFYAFHFNQWEKKWKKWR
jgi:hypothetical protein